MQSELEATFHEGLLIDSRFLVSEVISYYSRGIIIRAQDTTLDNLPIILKIFYIDKDVTPEELKRFRAELIIIRHLSHPGIEAVYDVRWFSEQFMYICTQDVNGDSLSSFLMSNESRQISYFLILSFMYEMTHILKTCHEKGVLHRSISPENIIVSIDEMELEQVYLLNFEYEKLIGRDLGHDGTGEIGVEDSLYMAPEQIKGEQIEQSADLYSLGMVTLSLLLGKPLEQPSDAGQSDLGFLEGLFSDVRSRNKDFPEWFFKLLEKLCSIDKEDRFKSAEDLQLYILETLKHKKNNRFQKRIIKNRPSILDSRRSFPINGEKVSRAKFHTISAMLVISLIIIFKGNIIPDKLVMTFSGGTNDVKTKNSLFQAVKERREAEVFSLLEKGVSPVIKDHAGTPLILIAVQLGYVDIAYTLLSHDPRVVDMQDSLGKTPLHVAIQDKNSDLVSLLTKYGANKNLLDSEGNTAQDVAISLNNQEVLRLLD